MIQISYKEYEIKINNEIIEIMKNYIQVRNLPENGGMLIGSARADANIIEINDITEPQELDKSSRFGFHRSDEHNKILRKKWIESEYKKMYLGEWHTHPQDTPSPSFLDKRSWKNLLKYSISDSKILIFIIIGFNTIEIWGGDRESKIIERCGSISL
ncbi:Mov34/MPN/PAD-1 family protein [Romboutsia sp. 1001216sp1]|uniref:Mov34/MPN/PAD-1 family protein n=1 Tax=Romboutsia sp. 1001216sp1 TaxID=2986997 RepID=UPI00232EC972|nr:Mov34/MPN/PAD-1 family protein [Romboutsia sp. 1001216sp1]MDB8803648.1 Mov34/MPN/PAD-1 family protein [Romboutsia sp. 1001216sp1]MDB8807850.1 Mov34/MPN/PAD-1 family protein [Romboutsia sp. 1001216sp1]MDB8809295.1 Mov34/MPN/PAD-1 family protein [Romboutsia sp. 1001216sp1]MDB8815044.1 Mov34/MPN/PAD-1 family protein [Romboutsia sp. 1001216sp1]MDB8817737.1 Mov34/MPN/PAD-1 family protein [Romboutsia sp. 1001216sp1]